jgi:hypothetical protein
LNLSGCGFPTTLARAAGQVHRQRIITTNHCASVMNIVTASGVGATGAGGTQTVMAKDTNSVTVVPISLRCDLTVSTNSERASLRALAVAEQCLHRAHRSDE